MVPTYPEYFSIQILKKNKICPRPTYPLWKFHVTVNKQFILSGLKFVNIPVISSYHRPFLVIVKWTYLWLRLQEKLTVKIWSCTWSVVSPNLPFFIIYMFLMAYTDTLNTFVFHFHPQYLAVQTNWRWYFWLGQWTYIFHFDCQRYQHFNAKDIHLKIKCRTWFLQNCIYYEQLEIF